MFFVQSPTALRPSQTLVALEVAVVGTYLLCLFLALLYSASTRLFWFDELFTLHLAQQPLALWSNLAHGADNNPPLSYLLTSLSIAIFGTTEWSVRLPAMLGAVVSCTCVYIFVRHRRSSVEAFLAMSIVTVTAPVWAFFLEGRPYGLLVGFTALSLLCWQRGWKIGFIMSMACGMCTHYYFVVPALSLFIAETVRTWQHRKFDRGMLAGFVVVGLALASTYPLWGYATKSYQAGFWAKVKFNRSAVEDTLHEFYRKEVTIPVMFALCVGVGFSRRKDDTSLYPLPETIAIVGLALGPVIGVYIGAKLVGAFYYRYILASILGFAIVFALTIARTSGSHRAALLLATGAFVLFGFLGNYRLAEGYYRSDAKEYREIAKFLADNSKSRVIVESAFDFSRAWHYDGDRLDAAFIADPVLAMKHAKADTVDRGILALSRIATVPLYSVDEVIAKLERGESLEFFGARTVWHSKELAVRGVVFTPIATRSNSTLYQLSLK